VETQKDRSLRRRIQSLQCFLFEQLHRELTQSNPATAPQSAQPPIQPLGTALPTSSEPASVATGKTAALITSITSPTKTSAAAAGRVSGVQQTPNSSTGARGLESETAVSGSEPGQQLQGSGLQAAQQQAGAEPTSRKSVIDATFGLVVRQRTKVMTGLQADKFRESRSFQVCTHLYTPICVPPSA